MDKYWCEQCGKPIKETDVYEAPCHEKVCESCCNKCLKTLAPYNSCMYMEESEHDDA